jgi:nucleotidyltransferase substrate binding protein (TIGR01987 family)
MSKIKIKYEKFSKALTALEAIYLKPYPTNDRIIIDACIQRFEFTFELAWKLLKDYFALEGILLNFPKEVLKEAYAIGLIEHEQLWLQMLNDRNLSSHTYNEKLADEIFQHIKNYVPLLKHLNNNISNKI